VLSIGKLAPGQHEYYLDTVARGAEEYYTAEGESPGRWTGRSAARLGLHGAVNGEGLGAVLSARNPGDGERLVPAQGRARTPGFDCTFSAPKSVSLLWALGPPDVARQVREAHDAAVDAALAVLEVEASRARRGRGGLVQVDADGFVAAAFRHRTSRAGDPQLHTHALVANLAYAPSEDRWTALDARPLYAWAKSAGYLYEAQLRIELTRRLGVEWAQPVRGIGEIAGFPRRVLRHFSQRRQQVEAHLADVGMSSGKAAQIATYATRTPKDRSTPMFSLFMEWRQRAAALGLDTDRLAAVWDGTARHGPVDPSSPGPGRCSPSWLWPPGSPNGAPRSPAGTSSSTSASFGRRELTPARSWRWPIPSWSRVRSCTSPPATPTASAAATARARRFRPIPVATPPARCSRPSDSCSTWPGPAATPTPASPTPTWSPPRWPGDRA
jgi:conjugative relaxase-like TrwC/TraI family protein